MVRKDKLPHRRDRRRLRSELEVLAALASAPVPSLATLRGAFETHTAVFLVVDLCAGGDLFSHLVAQVWSKYHLGGRRGGGCSGQ